MHGDQTGRDGGTKKVTVKEENETLRLEDLEHNEDGRGCCYQPLLKTDQELEAAIKSRRSTTRRPGNPQFPFPRFPIIWPGNKGIPDSRFGGERESGSRFGGRGVSWSDLALVYAT